MVENSAQGVERHRGDFYVESSCCLSCGVPQSVAPDLVGWIDEDMRHCFWKKQPATAAEMKQAFAIFDGQEVGCHRYAGTDSLIQARVGLDNCDYAPKPLSPRPPQFAPISFSAEGTSPPRELKLLSPEAPGLFRAIFNQFRRRS